MQFWLLFFNSIDYRKMSNFNWIAFCFYSLWFWIGQHDQYHTKTDKFSFVFKESCCFWVFSPLIWNVLWMHFSEKNLMHHLKKRGRDDPDISNKVIFLFYVWAVSPNIRDSPLNNSLNRCYSWMPYGSVVSRRFLKDRLKAILGSNTVQLFFKSYFFIIDIHLELFLVLCFLLNVLLIISFRYWFCILFYWI